MIIRKATLRDATQIKKLIDYYAKRDILLPRSIGDIYEKIREFTVYVDKNKILGCCSLQITWNDLAEIKSLAVDIKHTRKGIGSSLAKACIEEAKNMKIKRVFTLTTAPKFFKKLGFKSIKKEKLPMKIWGECVYCNRYQNCNESALVYEVK